MVVLKNSCLEKIRACRGLRVKPSVYKYPLSDKMIDELYARAMSESKQTAREHVAGIRRCDGEFVSWNNTEMSLSEYIRRVDAGEFD